jgi:hypothetical protein
MLGEWRDHVSAETERVTANLLLEDERQAEFFRFVSRRSRRAPTMPAAPLSGMVTSSKGGPLPNVVVTVLDGPDAGTNKTTTSAGGYVFNNLHQGGFTLQVAIAGYVTQSLPVTLTASQVLNVTLQRLPTADLTAAGALILTPAAPTLWNVAASIINQGDGCAIEISGMATVQRGQHRHRGARLGRAGRDGPAPGRIDHRAARAADRRSTGTNGCRQLLDDLHGQDGRLLRNGLFWSVLLDPFHLVDPHDMSLKVRVRPRHR